MRLSINWLKDFVPLPVSPQELAEKLTLAGLEIDALETFAPAFAGVIVAQALTVEPHPQADRLKVVVVNDGRQQRRVVCGAPNVQAGGRYAFAPVGAVLADGKPLKAAKIRGILSEGMLLAEDELGLSDDHRGLLELPPQTPVGADLAEVLGLNDIVLEVAVTPNRPDCLSVLGLAREVAALYDLPLHLPKVELVEDPEPVERYAQVIIEDPENCPRYTARMVVDVEVRPSPFWLRRRLQVCGLRAINNLVDVTNYVMLEYGQPLHAFDFQCLREGRIVVRRPLGEETFTTLDGQSRPLVHETLLICDAAQPVAIAGVMGGLDSEVTTATKRVLIESAYFHPPAIRKTAKRLGLTSESAYRFERGVDPEGVIPALNRAAQLMAELGSGRILRGLLDACPRPLRSPRLTLRLSRTNAVLGTTLVKDQVRDILRRLQMPPLAEDEDNLAVQVPSYRGDLIREIDLIEEVARLHGFANIPVTLPRVEMWARRPSKEARLREQVRELLVGMGFAEVITYAFQPERLTAQLFGTTEGPEFVRLANPISEEQAVMRVALLPGLVETMRRNVAHLSRDLKIFELGMVFRPRPGEQLPQETLLLAGLMTGARQTPAWNLAAETPVDYFDLKGVVENLLTGLLVTDVSYQPAAKAFLRHGTAVVAAGHELGFLGELHPETAERCELKQPAWVFELNFAHLAAAAQDSPRFQPLPRYPAVFRDLAIILSAAIPAAQVQDVLFACGRPLLVEAQLFDVYTGPPVPAGERSLAFHLCYRDPDRTLTEEDVNPWHEAIIQGLAKQLGARLRA